MKHLGELNTTRFFCGGCGMTAIDDITDWKCPVCRRLEPPRETERTPLPVLALFLLGIAIVACGSWYLSRI